MKVGLILALFLCLSIYATDVQIGESYRVAGGSLETTTGTIISEGSYVKVTGTHQGWAYGVQVLQSNFVPLEEIHYISQDWGRRTLTPLTLEEVIRMVQLAPEEVEEATEAPCLCDDDVERAIALAMQHTTEESPYAPRESLLPQARPTGLTEARRALMSRPTNVRSAEFSSFVFKDEGETDRYFACYQKDTDLQMDYAGTYKNSIRRMSQVYGQQTGGSVRQGDMDTLMSCLIFRESAHWRGGTSSTGAQGLGQFTGVARDEVREIINYRPNSVRDHDERIRERQSEREAGRIDQTELNRDIRSIDAERRRHERLSELQRMWDAMPMSNRPSASQITSDFTANNNNHEAIMAMSALLVRNCQIRLEDDGIEMDARTSLLACAGAYNMGVGGFMSNAIVRNGPQNLEGWLANLEDSNDPQADETYNHLVSIHRCISDGENFPPCGTQSNYCSALPMANSCLRNAAPQCLGECR